jgi:hypothetical protein
MDIKHLFDFDFYTSSLGSLRIGNLKSYSVKDIRAEASTPEVDARALSLRIFADVADKHTGDESIDRVCGGPPVTSAEATELTDEELDKFAEQYGARFFGKNDGIGPTTGEPRGVDFLILKINESKNLEEQRHAKLLDDARNFHGKSNSHSIRSAIEAANSLSSFGAVQKILEERRRWDEMRKIVEPFENLRHILGDVPSWRKTLDELSKPKLIADQLRSYLDNAFNVSNLLEKYHETSGWLSSLQHARNAYAESSILNSIKEAQRTYQNISKQWEIPSHLVGSVGALTALQEQIGRLTLPVMEWSSAVALARQLGPAGLQAELAALGINENGELTHGAVESTETGLLNNSQRDLLTLLSIVLTLLIFFYQERSSGQWQSSVDNNFAAQKVMLERQQKQLESLSILVEKALVKEAARVNTRFVVRERPAIVRARPQSGTSVDGRLFPREVVTLISERGKWIEVRYYHWQLKEYRTGWILKKYLTRVPASQQAVD